MSIRFLRRPFRLWDGALVLVALVFLLVLWTWMPSVHYSPEIRARVVAPDGKPVRGAIVVAGWKIRTMYFNNTYGQLALYEVVTDGEGNFRIPAWGPRLLWKGVLMIDEPTVRIFKPGFIPLIVRNVRDVPMKGAPAIIRFRLQDQALTLLPFQGSLPEYARSLEPLMSSMDEFIWFEGPDLCYRERVPRLFGALQDLQNKMTASGHKQSLRHAQGPARPNRWRDCQIHSSAY